MLSDFKKELAEKSTGELLGDYEWLESVFQHYSESGQGISTKETVEMNCLVAELESRGIKL